MNRKNLYFDGAFYLFFIILVVMTSGFPFFWDTIQLASKHATYFYTTNFRSIILPNEIDSGHIPALGIYLALVWKVFGRTLETSHLAMLPFVLGIVYHALVLVRNFFSRKWQYAALIILLLDPTLLAQSTLVSPDVPVMFFLLMAINSMKSKKRILYCISLTGLTLASMRGMMCVAGFFTAEIILKFIELRQSSRSVKRSSYLMEFGKIASPYLVPAFTALLFFGWHWHETGWIGFHKNMPWYPFFAPVDFKGALFNTFILGWRLADFGRIFIWITGLFCFICFIRNRGPLPYDFTVFAVTAFILLVVLGQAVVLHMNLSGHRYLLPVYITFTLTVLYYMFEVTGDNYPKKLFVWLMIAGLLSGNFWVYPDRIAKGWDSTLAYIPYFPLRDRMMKYMENEGIPIEQTGTSFPNEGRLDLIELNGDMRSFAEKNFETNRYIFWSNIYNDFTDRELLDLRNSWIKLHEIKFLQVKVILYKSPHY